MKNETCSFETCRFSQQCNHIHCVRENCFYVLHSSGQLLSHKRKHERMDSEQAYRRFKLAQKMQMISSGLGSTSDSNEMIGPGSTTTPPPPQSSQLTTSTPSIPFFMSNNSGSLLDYNKMAAMMLPTDLTLSFSDNKADNSSNTTPTKIDSILMQAMGSNTDSNSLLPLQMAQKMQYQKQLLLQKSSVGEENQNMAENGQETLKSLMSKLETIQRHPSVEDVGQMIRLYFTDQCTRMQTGNVTEQGIKEENDADLNEQNEPLNLKSEKKPKARLLECASPLWATVGHLHCLVPGCETIVPQNLVEISEHVRFHESQSNVKDSKQPRNKNESIASETSPSTENQAMDSNLLQITSIEGFFNRKRGRPPKNRVVEVYNNVSINYDKKINFL